MNNNLDDEIVIGINRPKAPKKDKKNKKKSKQKQEEPKKENKQTKKVAKKATSKKKDKPKKSKKGLVVLIVIVVSAGIVVLLMNVNICTIKKVEVTGNDRVSKKQIEELANLNQYNNLFAINNIKIKDDLKKNAYIEDAKIFRKFPSGVKIEIKERTPKYMLQVADSYVYINNQGYMLEVSSENLGLPIILGFKTDLSNAKAGNRLDVDDLKKMETIIKIVETAKTNEIADYITKIDVSDDRNYTLVMESEQKTVYLGDCSDLNTKILYLTGILTQTKNVAGEIFLNMDLNTDDAYFREQT